MLNLKPPKNQNYCALVTELKHFAPLAGCDNVQAALINGNQVIVDKDTQPGDIGLYFPPETALSHDFLAANNLYRKPEWGNADPTKKGFFEESGRVKCVKFRGHKSEGFWLPVGSLNYLGIDVNALGVGQEFDEIQIQGLVHEICRKYVPKRNTGRLSGTMAPRAGRAETWIVPRQFEYHIDTAKLDRNINKLTPDTYISITDKWHGTSAIFAHVLVNRPLAWYEKLLKRLGVQIREAEYDYVWSSRRVIKGVGDKPREGVNHFYKSDIWGTVFHEIKALIPKGWTIYGEIVGWTPDGAPIQAGYHYGCPTGGHKFMVYRISVTNPAGNRVELTNKQIRSWCASVGLQAVFPLWEGRADNLLNKIDRPPNAPVMLPLQEWQEKFLAHVKSLWVNDSDCPHNNYEVPAEGVVVRFETRHDEFEAYKCKNFRFTAAESVSLDKGVLDMETAEDVNLTEEIPECL